MLLFLTVTLLPGLLAVTMPDDAHNCNELRKCKSRIGGKLLSEFDGQFNKRTRDNMCGKLDRFYRCSTRHSRLCFRKRVRVRNEMEVATMAHACSAEGKSHFALLQVDSNYCLEDTAKLQDTISKLSDCYGTFRSRLADFEASNDPSVSTFCSLLDSLGKCITTVASTCSYYLKIYAKPFYEIQASVYFKGLQCPQLEKSACWEMNACLEGYNVPSIEPRDFGIGWVFESQEDLDYKCFKVRGKLEICFQAHRHKCHKYTETHFQILTKLKFLEAICDESTRTTIENMTLSSRLYNNKAGLSWIQSWCSLVPFGRNRCRPYTCHSDPSVCADFSQQKNCTADKMASIFKRESELRFMNRIAPFFLSEHLYRYDAECQEREKCRELINCESQFINRSYTINKDAFDYELAIPPERRLVNLCKNFRQLVQCWEMHSGACKSLIAKQQAWDTMKWVKSMCFTDENQVGAMESSRCSVAEGEGTTLECTFPIGPSCSRDRTLLYWFVSDRFKAVSRCYWRSWWEMRACRNEYYDDYKISAGIEKNETHITASLEIGNASRSVAFDVAAGWSCIYSTCKSTYEMKKITVCPKLHVTGPCTTILDLFNKPLGREIRPGDLYKNIIAEFSVEEVQALCQVKKEITEGVKNNMKKCAEKEFLESYKDLRVLEYFCTDGGFKLFSEMKKTSCIELTREEYWDRAKNKSFVNSGENILDPRKRGCLCAEV